MRKFLIGIAMAVATMMPFMMIQPAWAETDESCGVATNLIHCDQSGNKGEAIFSILRMVIRIFSSIVMIAAVVGVIIAGVQYLSARDNEGQVVKAKMRIFQVVIGMVVYALVWAFLEWVIPGGIQS